MRKFIAFCMLMLAVAVGVFYSGFALPIRVNVFLLTGAAVTDSFTTWLCLRKKREEGNPAVAFLFKKVGFSGTLTIWYVLFGLNIWFKYIPSDVRSQTGVWCAYWLVPLNNIWVYWKARRGNKRTTVQLEH